MLVLDTPGEGDFDESRLKVFFDVVFKGLEGGDGFLRVEGSVEKLFVELSRFASKPVAFFLRNAVQMLSCEEASRQWTPGDQTIVILLEQFLVVEFHFLPDKQIVLILSTDGFMQVVLLAESECVEDILGVPVAGAPVKGLAVFDELVEGAADLFEGCVLVVAVGEEHVDVVELQTGEGLVDGLADVFSVDIGGAVRLGVVAGPDLGGDDDVLAGDVEVFEDLACY